MHTACLLFKFCLFGEEVADGKLVSDDQVSQFDALKSLLISVFVPVQLRVDGAQLQVQPALELELVNPSRNTLVL